VWNCPARATGLSGVISTVAEPMRNSAASANADDTKQNSRLALCFLKGKWWSVVE
jgi:hypothetical protein